MPQGTAVFDMVERLATAAAGEMEEVEEEQHSGAFRNSSPTGLAPAAFSMTAAEESTQGNLSTMQLASGGNDHACLDTTATNIAAAEEIGHVASVTTTEAAGNDNTEQDSLCCSEMPENSTSVGNPVNLIPIGLDTVVVSPATGETGIEGCMDAVENLPAADNSLERVLAAEYSAGNSETASSSVSVADADDGKEPSEDEAATPNASTLPPGGSDEGESNIFATPGDMPPQAFVHVDKFTSELVHMRDDLRGSFSSELVDLRDELRQDLRDELRQAIGALSAQITACFTKTNENTTALDNRMQTQFATVNKTVTANYDRLEGGWLSWNVIWAQGCWLSWNVIWAQGLQRTISWSRTLRRRLLSCTISRPC
jgi:hypothetical protein